MATPLEESVSIDTSVYTVEEKRALLQLRISIMDILKERNRFDSDTYLIKVLRGWKLNVSKTEKMIRMNIEYFEVNGLDYFDKWQIPEVIEKYLPHGTFGVDREGHPVQYIRFGRLDIVGLTQSASLIEIIRKMHKNSLFIEDKFVELSNKFGKKIDKMILIIDLEGIDSDVFHSRPLSYLKSIIRAGENNYAGSMVYIFIITNSPLFRIFWEIVCQIIDEETKKKVKVFRPNECEQKLTHYISPEQLPQCYGGTACYPDTFCTEAVGMGGVIPQRYYLKNILQNERQSELTLVPIRARSSAQIPIEVTRARSILCWEFKTESYDINFAIYFHALEEEVMCHTTELNCVLNLQRRDSHLVAHKGDIICITPGMYILYWDNTYSWFHDKEVQYVCNVVEPNSIF